MNLNTKILPAAIGAPLAGGFFAGLVTAGAETFALIVAPKATGEREGKWSDNRKQVAGALSYCDGMKNTIAMAEAGSALALWARGITVAGYDDWYLPSQDELEILYRAFKPTEETNTGWARSGINLSAVPPTRPYTDSEPSQTAVADFIADGAQAFDDAWYWSSTQHASNAGYAWDQYFGNGFQGYSYGGKSYAGRARAVRRLAI